MIRNLKILIAAAMAFAAFSAVGASGAQAAEFHCHVEPCVGQVNPDGTGKTAHQVFIVKRGGESVSTTCNTIDGSGTNATKTSATVTLENIVYATCTVAGSPSEVDMNGCDYLFNASGAVDVECPGSAEIEIIVPATGCVFSIGSQALNGISYHNIGATANNTTEVTVSANVANIDGNVNNKCPIAAGAFSEGEYTTGNAIVTGETNTGQMSNIWWA